MSMMWREFQSLGSLKKYELRVVLLLETLWQSFVPKDLVFEVEKEINCVILKLLLESLSDLIKIEYPSTRKYTSAEVSLI